MPHLPANLLGSLMLAQADAGVPRTFYPFTRDHYLAVAACALITFILAYLGVRWRGTKNGQRLRYTWVAIAASVQVLSLYFYMVIRPFRWGHSLPLEICDLGGFISVFAIASGRRIPRIILYYWAFALTTHAFITPILRQGPDTLRYYVFWASHLIIVASAVYDLTANRFRPKGWDFAMITLVMLLYGALVIPLNIIMDFNYGFTGNAKPDTATIIDKLGPWPLRLIWMFLLIEVIFAALTLVWWRPNREPADPNR